MTVSTAIAKIITTLASNEKGRKVIGAALLTPIVIILLGIGVFIALLTGLFSLLYGAVRDTSVSQSWNDIRKNVESALSGVNSSINTQVKNDTYSFMPDFSINLSKSVLQKTFSEGNNSFLLLYDTKEVNDSVAKAKKYIDKLKKVKSQKELEQLNEEIDLSSYKYSELAKDKKFRDDKLYDMSKYSQSTVQLINTLVKPEMPTYDYDEETVTIDGVKAKKQILTVHKDNKTQIVEYTCYGEGDIYLPRLLALYQAETFSRFEDMAESDASGLDNDIASAIENVSSDESGGATADGFDVACLNVFQAQEIGQIFERAALEGKFSAKVSTEKTGTTEKLSITVKTPSEDDWYEMFNVDEKYRDYTKENTQIIERILSDAQINNLYISVDSTAQRALFVYFQGFFNLPVEADDLKENTNGILTTLNDFETIHSRGSSAIGKAYESGITLYLNDEDTEVRAEILPDVGECIQDVYIYDVYDAEKRKVVKDKPNYTYNCSAVQLAYIIDTDVFAEEYGFDFPTIVTTTGTEIKHEDGVLTLMIEYSCLDRLETISEQDIGLSLYDVYDKDEKVVIGYAHSGKHSKEKDEGLSATGWSHTFGSEIIPHLCVKTAFVDGEVTPPELDNPHIYDGLSVRFVGAKVNPLLWFKAYRTDVNKDLLDSISAIQVKK